MEKQSCALLNKFIYIVAVLLMLTSAPAHSSTTMMLAATDQHQLFLPMITTPACVEYSAHTTVTGNVHDAPIGTVITVTAVLENTGCVDIGMPGYFVSASPSTIVTLIGAPQQTHFISLSPGKSDTIQFTFKAIAPGRVTIKVAAFFEVNFINSPFLPGSAVGLSPSLTILPPEP